jgi:hypothetical protein
MRRRRTAAVAVGVGRGEEEDDRGKREEQLGRLQRPRELTKGGQGHSTSFATPVPAWTAEVACHDIKSGKNVIDRSERC